MEGLSLPDAVVYHIVVLAPEVTGELVVLTDLIRCSKAKVDFGESVHPDFLG